MKRCPGLDGKFRENCVVFHCVLLCQTYNILLPGETFVIPLELQALSVTYSTQSTLYKPLPVSIPLCECPIKFTQCFVKCVSLSVSTSILLQKRSLYHVVILPLWSPSSDILLDFKAI